MSETTINQRLNFLLKELGMKAGAFARALDLSETTVRNYIDRTAKPSSEVLEKISNTFEQVNLVWLVTGKGEPFLTGSQSSTTQIGKFNQAGTGNKQTNSSSEYQLKAALESANKEITLLREQLAMKDQLIAAKEEILTLLRSQFNRPN